MILKVIAKVAIKGRFQRFKHSTHVSDLGKETLKNVHQRNYRIFKEGKRGGRLDPLTSHLFFSCYEKSLTNKKLQNINVIMRSFRSQGPYIPVIEFCYCCSPLDH